MFNGATVLKDLLFALKKNPNYSLGQACKELN